MKIEKVNIEDASELLSIYAPYVRDTAITFEYDVPTLDEFKNRIIDISSRYPYLKAVENGEILGYTCARVFRSPKAYNWSVETSIYVKLGKHRMGIGKLLYNELEKSLKNMGILNLNACISVPTKEDKHLTDASYHFHKSMGYTLVGRFHNSGYKFNTWYDMIWMEKMIGEHNDNPSDVQFGKWTLTSD